MTGDPVLAARRLDGAVAAVRDAAGLLGQEAFAAALAADVAAWRAAGLATPPLFDRTRDAYRPPAGDAPTLFAGPVRATNGPVTRGHFLELFLAWREEPAECKAVAADRPHPKNTCQSTRLIIASRGFAEGNCIVFFPENVAARGAPAGQDYALFFFNRFHRIYREQTLPEVRRRFGPSDLLTGAADWVSGTLDGATCYRARCVWGYLHDCFHHRGPRPFDEQMHVKLTWFAGLLEEIKGDAEMALACLDGRCRTARRSCSSCCSSGCCATPPAGRDTELRFRHGRAPLRVAARPGSHPSGRRRPADARPRPPGRGAARAGRPRAGAGTRRRRRPLQGRGQGRPGPAVGGAPPLVGGGAARAARLLSLLPADLRGADRARPVGAGHDAGA